jgi:sensor c-di-GMP phosphodiesterase-like protein
MGQKVVAEGIEDQETLDRFRQLSCDFAQGYSFGRPMPSHALHEWLVERGARVLRDQVYFDPQPVPERGVSWQAGQ